MSNYSQDERNAQLSKGISSNSIYEAVFEEFKILDKIEIKSYADIGCGSGNLLNELIKRYSFKRVSGVDIVDYNQERKFEFIHQNLNQEFTIPDNSFDIITCIEVIEHLENPRLLLRELAKSLKKDGIIILSTPNTYSLLSLLSFILKGFHSSFGPKDYPAHITPVTPYQLTSIISEIPQLKLEKLFYIPNGRIPGTSKQWSDFIFFLKGKRFSDNYYCVIKKV